MDKKTKINISIIGMILSTLSLILLYFNLNAILIILVLSISILWYTLKEQKLYLEHLMKKWPQVLFYILRFIWSYNLKNIIVKS